MGDITVKAVTNSCGTKIVLGQTYQLLNIVSPTEEGKHLCYEGNTSIVGSVKVIEIHKAKDAIMARLCSPTAACPPSHDEVILTNIDLLISPSLGPIARQFGSAADYLACAK